MHLGEWHCPTIQAKTLSLPRLFILPKVCLINHQVCLLSACTTATFLSYGNLTVPLLPANPSFRVILLEQKNQIPGLKFPKNSLPITLPSGRSSSPGISTPPPTSVMLNFLWSLLKGNPFCLSFPPWDPLPNTTTPRNPLTTSSNTWLLLGCLHEFIQETESLHYLSTIYFKYKFIILLTILYYNHLSHLKRAGFFFSFCPKCPT